MKVNAQLEGKPVIRNLAKLLMNSLYGRFGMRSSNLLHKIVDQKEYLKLDDQYEIIRLIQLNGMYYLSYQQSESLTLLEPKPTRTKFAIPSQTNVPIAAAVTAYSRIIINQLKLDAIKKYKCNLYYSDTDSLVLDRSLPPEYLDSATLGKLKLEYKLKEGIFISPKINYLLTEDNQEVFKAKGYSGKLTRGDYEVLLGGGSLDLTMTKWFRSLKTQSISIQHKTPYKISPIFNKRTTIFEDGVWVNTRALIINDTLINH